MTIFRKATPDCAGYTGEPTAELTDHNGEVVRVRARVACHCSCLVGQWMRGNCTADVCRRVPMLARVGLKNGGMENWTTLDPTIDWPDTDDEVPDWKAFRRMIATGKSVVKKIYPESNGNRVSAYREMAEPLPGSRPEFADSPVPF